MPGLVLPSKVEKKKLKAEVSLWKRIEYFASKPRRKNIKEQQSSVILNLCLSKTRSGKSKDYRFRKSKCFFQECFRKAPFSTSTSFILHLHLNLHCKHKKEKKKIRKDTYITIKGDNGIYFIYFVHGGTNKTARLSG